MEIRSEIEADFEQVHDLHASAFPNDAEAKLVASLRADGDAAVSLVAVKNAVVGHVMFSRMEAPFPALALAPVAVTQNERNQGVAAELIKAGLKMAKADGWEGVFVLGAPAYYTRFGFDVTAAKGFGSPYSGPYFMALSLQKAEFVERSGKLVHAKAFHDLG